MQKHLPQKNVTPFTVHIVVLSDVGYISHYLTASSQLQCFCACRALSAPANMTNSHHSVITVVDTAGFQNPAACGRRGGATFTDLCQNYVQERLHGLYRQSAVSSITRLWMKVSFFVYFRQTFSLSTSQLQCAVVDDMMKICILR